VVAVAVVKPGRAPDADIMLKRVLI
jgi:hypothetical protein